MSAKASKMLIKLSIQRMATLMETNSKMYFVLSIQQIHLLYIFMCIINKT